MSGLYVYALVQAPVSAPAAVGGAASPADLPDHVEGLTGEPLRLLDCGGVVAAVGELAAPPVLSREALAAHDAVVRRLAETLPATLPARFGQWTAGAEELAAALAPRRRALAAALAQVGGCVQMTLRLFLAGTRESVEWSGDRTAAAGEGDGRGLAGPGARYLAGRRRALAEEAGAPGDGGAAVALAAGAALGGVVMVDLPQEIQGLRRALAPLIRSERLLGGGMTGRLLATAHDLVARQLEASYRHTVEMAAAEAHGWRVRLSGPWPPYAFAPGLFT
ncbi:MAG TPA: GvpL/GvpF family gas vesicle protein [Thermoanaerobaculia bacterium]|nr:GvpL/GvpF family gas vesicle protein [Thermoanaerobaculia bacterium]